MRFTESNNKITFIKDNHLFFDDYYDEPVENLQNILLSKSIDIDLTCIKYITFGIKFNQLVNNLPDSILGIKFGYSFNQPVNNLPQNLTSLEFGDCFNQPIYDLSNNLTYLKFGNSFNQPLFNLPNNLTYLEFGENYYHCVDYLPKTLEILIFSYEKSNFEKYQPSGTYNGSKIDNSVLYVGKIKKIYYTLNNLPYNLKELQLNEKYLKNKVENLPIFLSELRIPEKLKNMIDKIPFGCNITYM